MFGTCSGQSEGDHSGSWKTAGDGPASDRGVMFISCPFSLHSCSLGGAQLHAKISVTLLDTKIVFKTMTTFHTAFICRV